MIMFIPCFAEAGRLPVMTDFMERTAVTLCCTSASPDFFLRFNPSFTEEHVAVMLAHFKH